jgi:hypothetical protein
MKSISLHDRLDILSRNGVELVDSRQIFIDDSVSLDRIFPGAVLFPGTRLMGANTLVAPGARIGSEGPATIVNAAIGEEAEIASGFVTDSVLLRKARIGSNGHIRGGTLLEEEASTAHAVGLKHTVLTSFVTLGSLINCCDCLISGGRSRTSHTEVGSGFIHFNYTPWGESGDKATPSIIGGIPRSVFLREERIFVGGLSGAVGPAKIGFGSFTVAGQVIRSDVLDRTIYSEVPRKITGSWDFRSRGLSGPRVERNLLYIGHLVALRAWYTDVRKARLSSEDRSSHLGITLDAATRLLDASIAERWLRLRQFLGTQSALLDGIRLPNVKCPLAITAGSTPYPHIEWIRSLTSEDVKLGTSWLEEIVTAFTDANQLREKA